MAVVRRLTRLIVAIVSIVVAFPALSAAAITMPPNPENDFFRAHFDWEVYQFTPAAAVPVKRSVANELLQDSNDGFPQYLFQCRDNQLDRTVAPLVDEDCYFVHRFDAPYQLVPGCDFADVTSCYTEFEVPGWVEPDRPFPCKNARCFLTLSSSATEIITQSPNNHVLFWEILINPYEPFYSPRLDSTVPFGGQTTEFSLLDEPATRPVGVLITTPPSNGTVECTNFGVCTYTSASTPPFDDTFEFILNYDNPFYQVGIVTMGNEPPIAVPEVPFGILLPMTAAAVIAVTARLRRRTT